MTFFQTLRARLFSGWMAFAHVLGIVNTTILLSLVYVAMILPMKLVWFLIRKDPLRLHQKKDDSLWEVRRPEESTLEERSHPF